MEIPILGGAACARCGDNVDGAAELCRACRLAPPPFERAVAYAFYEGRMRAAIHALKYDRMRAASRRLGGMLAQAIAQLDGEAPRDLLVIPVPLHRSRYAQRGFNQARLLARHAIRALHRSDPQWRLTLAPAALMRLRATETQASLTPRQRRLNVRGAFRVADAAAVRDRHVLLVDDILTTGATARAAAQALKDAGAGSVWVATLARARRIHAIAARAAADAHGLISTEKQSGPEGHLVSGEFGLGGELAGSHPDSLQPHND